MIPQARDFLSGFAVQFSRVVKFEATSDEPRKLAGRELVFRIVFNTRQQCHTRPL